MAFSKSFPKTTHGKTYPEWVEVYLSSDEEKEIEKKARIDNLRILMECIDDAKKVFDKKELKQYQTDIIRSSVALFEKRASHEVFLKENKCKEKFDKENQIKS